MASDCEKQIYALAQKIPRGQTATYGQLALLAGRPRAARRVGRAMRRAPEDAEIPWHRVVFRDGSLCGGCVFGGVGFQRQMLEAEGVPFDEEGRVQLEKCRWPGPEKIPGGRQTPEEE